MSLRNMNIAPRAFLGFALIGTLMLILGGGALLQMSKIRTSAEEISTSSVPSIQNLGDFTQLTLRLRVLSYRLLINREPDVQQKTMQLLDLRNQQIRTAQRDYEKCAAPTSKSVANLSRWTTSAYAGQAWIITSTRHSSAMPTWPVAWRRG